MISIADPQKRLSKLREILLCLRPDTQSGKKPVPAKNISRRDGIILLATDNLSPDSYRDGMFQTFEKNTWIHYSEIWNNPSVDRLWKLKTLSLQIYIVPSPNIQEEVFALHCEPTHTGASPTDRYKRGPHVHVTQGGVQLAHAHIPLQLTDLEKVMESTDSFTNFLIQATELVRTEIIPKL